jgi:ParB family chromosome partitioning protein
LENTIPSEISLDLIDIGPRLRKVKEAQVDAMASSMRERGQITPIEIRPRDGGRYLLTVGAHRIAAVKKLGWATIRAEIKNCSDDEALLREIDENLYRTELIQLDKSELMEQRRQIYERIEGLVKRGGNRRSKGQVVPLIGQIKAKSNFFKETSAQFGLHERDIKRALTRKAQIVPTLWTALRDTEAADNGALLDKIRKLELQDQLEIARLLKETGCTVKDAIRVALGQSEIEPDTRDYGSLMRLWKRVSPELRKRFLKDIGELS